MNQATVNLNNLVIFKSHIFFLIKERDSFAMDVS